MRSTLITENVFTFFYNRRHVSRYILDIFNDIYIIISNLHLINLFFSFLVHVDLRSHVRIVHEKTGDTGIPVYAASTKLSQDLIPTNYTPVHELNSSSSNAK